MKRMRAPAHPLWRAERDAAGQWVVRDATGQDPLRSADPLVRLEAVHLAAAAPQLRAALTWLVQDFHQLELTALHLRHRVRLNFAEVALVDAKPPLREWLLLTRSKQSEFDLAA